MNGVKIIYESGDILDSQETIILHIVNSKGVMASGIAKSIRDKYPVVYQKYMDHHRDNGLKLGEAIWVDVGSRFIINGVGQQNYGRDKNIRYVSYDAIQKIISSINANEVLKAAADNGECVAVGMPLIGCGLGNGKWSIISAIIEEEATNFVPVVYTL